MTQSQGHIHAAKVEVQVATSSALLQRKCACGGGAGLSGDCEECSGQRLQRKPAGPDVPSAVPAVVHDVLHSPGQPLDSVTRAFMESRFGHDFSRVRTHADARAAESARAVDALAYTVGQHVVFGRGKYAPDTPSGQKLLAHELAHVVQQRNATYPASGLTLADGNGELEADSAAEAAVAGRPARVVQHTTGPQLARQKDPAANPTSISQKKRLSAGGKEVDVERRYTPGKCVSLPETRKGSKTEVTIENTKITLSYCRGRTRVETTGVLDYRDVVSRAVNAAPDFLSAQNPQSAVEGLKQSFRQAAPTADLDFNVQIGGLTGEVALTATASLESGVSGKGSVTLGRGKNKLKLEGSAGSNQPTTAIVSLETGAPKPVEPDCFRCECGWNVEYRCEPVEKPEGEKPPPKPLAEIIYVPLFFQYEQATPRKGFEDCYRGTLDYAIERIKEGYTIARIEGRTSPEGPLRSKQPGGFENRTLAKQRAEQAQKDLQTAIRKAQGAAMYKLRDADPISNKRLKEALSRGYLVQGTAPGGPDASAELFGSTEQGKEVPERDLPSHLKDKLRTPKDDQSDPLVDEHVIGPGLAPDCANVKQDVDAFRSRQRDGKALKDPALVETMYRPLRRALIVLAPPATPSLKLPTPTEIATDVVGKQECLPEFRAAFDQEPVPVPLLFEGSCPAGGGGKKK